MKQIRATQIRTISAILAFCVIALFLFFRNTKEEPAQEITSRNAVQSLLHAVTPAAEKRTAIVTDASEQATVVRVIDGDTIDVEVDGKTERVRYIGIDTPETVHPSKPVECMGAEASAKNKELVLGSEVRLVKDITDRDKYGRLLRYVYQGDTFVNEALVRGGFASVYTYPPDVAFIPLFLEAQDEAREENRGLWAVCEHPEEKVIGAPEYGPNGCSIKGNISASGEKIFHTASCDYYAKTRINTDAGEQWFCSEDDALSAGWRKALNCS